ncbi:Uncharacterized protein OS=Chlorobium sp. GBChlB GN=HY22_07765 PE=4 SV=1 [Gemmata massiliana]|uniref:Signal peptide prediction n=1 Tax=Gemmata massiliana TaxID=1210884 RepID=A0A6P2D378_9BACT|nr:hypothetical protein [Gemmata massiliana]VTR93902.1 Uncharacterized protein OS=Chlorobium sp. GBChlB GN=HY22_07765 PE=4 SV=1 [Gemmata massiliana]
MLRLLTLPFRYLWALPVTLLGVPVVPLTLVTGGRVRVERGALEVYGGFARFFLLRCLVIKASAMCLGHIILGQDRESLDHSRDHEHVHVRQCERWGAFIVPAYLLSSFLAWRRGGHFYFDNRFEREAYGLDR